MSFAGNPSTNSDPFPNEQLAGWWYRVGATIIDGLIIGIPVGIIGAISGSRVVLYLLLVIAQLTYTSLLLTNKGQTVGMMAVGTRCADQKTGANLTLQQALLRTVVSLASSIGSLIAPVLGVIVGIFTLLDDLWPLWDPQNQTIHDKAVGSLVLKKRTLVPEPPVPGSGSTGYGASPPPYPGANPSSQAPGGWGTTGAAGAGWPGQPASPPPAPPAQSGPPPVESAAGGSSTPAAWYPDPAGSGQERWWDGRSWTDHLRPAS